MTPGTRAVPEVGGSPEEHFRILFDGSPAAQCLVDADGRFCAVNAAMERLLGRTESDLVGGDVVDVTPDDEVEAYRERLGALVAGDIPSVTTDRSFVHADGHRIAVVLTATLLRDDDGCPWRIVTSAVDVSAQGAVMDALRRSEERFRILVENGCDLVAVVDRGGIMRYLSPSVERTLGPHPAWEIGRHALEAVHPDDVEHVRRAFCSLVRHPTQRPSFEYRVRHAGPGWRHLRASATNVLDVADVDGIVFNAFDVTEHHEVQRALHHQAAHDQLTGLLNRTGLRSHLDHTLARPGAGPLSLLAVDLDRFKLVNESYGSDVGDAVLLVAGDRIRQHVRAGDVVARFSGDEFVVCCADCTPGETAAIADRIARSFREPVEVHGECIHISVSIGIAGSGSDGHDTPERLLSDVAAAVDKAKALGRARCEVFDLTIRQEARARLETERGLRDALVAERLQLWYQPQVDLGTGRVIGAESLMRWRHPTRGLIMPSEFIPVAEGSDLICELGSWALRRVCLDLDHVPGEVSVNLSARELDQCDLVSRVAETLRDTGADPARVWIEITETVLMSDAARHAEVLSGLRDLGLRVAVDDFGTGYSSLAYLRRFPVDYLKIDRSFVDGVGTDDEDTAVAAAIIGLAHTLGMQVVAEGIELPHQRDVLSSLGCDYGQGFLFGRPQPLEVFAGGMALA